MKNIILTFILGGAYLSSSAQINSDNQVNRVNENTMHHHDDGIIHETTYTTSSGRKVCDTLAYQTYLKIVGNGTCPALEEYIVWDSGKTFYEYFPDFPKCPQVYNYVSDKEGYYSAINDWCSKHKEDEELIHQILGFSTELKE